MTRLAWMLVLACTSVLGTIAATADDPAPTSTFPWATDGPVTAVYEHNGVVYIGGGFTRVAPPANLIGGLFRASQASGAVSPGWPKVDGQVWAVEPDPSGGVYIGGTFTTIDGSPRPYLAHILPNGTLDPAFTPVPGGSVLQLALGATHLFVLGNFGTVNGQTAFRFAALHPGTGALANWSQSAIGDPSVIRLAGDRMLMAGRTGASGPQPPTTNVVAFTESTGAVVWNTNLGLGPLNGTTVQALAVGGGRVMVGGLFVRQATPTAWNLLALDLATGVVDPVWAPSPTGGPLHQVSALAVAGSTLYVGGFFTAFGGQDRRHAAAVDIASGTVLPWNPRPDSTVTRLATAADGTLFMQGAFQQAGGSARAGLAAFDATGALSAWVPDASSYHTFAVAPTSDGHVFVGAESALSGGVVRRGLAAFDAATDAVLDWAPTLTVDRNERTRSVVTMTARGDSLYLAGSFAAVNDGPRAGLAAVSIADGSVLAWNPGSTIVPGLVGTLIAVGDHVYAAGDFHAIGGLPAGVSPRNLARLDPVTGAVDAAWRAQPDLGVRGMVTDGRSLFIAGIFNSVQGFYRARLASVDLATGRVTPWRPIIGSNFESVDTLARDGQTLYLGGTFTSVNGLERRGSAAVDTSSGATLAWHPERPAPAFFHNSMTVADGMVVRPSYVSAVQGVHRLHGIDAEGRPTAWQPLLGVNLADETMRVLVATTARYVLAVGAFKQLDDGSPGQGLAGFARAGSGTPTALRALSVAGGIRLEWQAPTLGVPSRYQIEAGGSPGAREVLVHTTTGADTAFETARPAGGTFFVRVRAQDAGGATSGPSNEIALAFGCTAPPPAPFAPTVSLAGSRVSVGWSQPGYSDATHAVIEAGSGPGLANLARLVTTALAPFEADAPAGTYFVRVRAANACGESAPSNDISFTVGSGAAIPARPEWTRAEVGPGTVTLSWAAVVGATGYVIEAGSAATLVDVAQLTVGPLTSVTVPGVPAGIYTVRVRAMGPAGTGPPGPETGFAVP